MGEEIEMSQGEKLSGDLTPIVRQSVRTFQEFVSSLENQDFRDRTVFQQAVWFLCQLGVSDTKLGSALETTPNAVNRWVNGRSAPVPIVRKIAIQTALTILREDGLKIAGVRYDPFTGARRTAS